MIAAYIAAFAAIVAFAVLLQTFGVIGHARLASEAARESMNALNDPKLSDDEKERAAQTASLHLFGAFLQIALRSLAALAVPGAVLWAADRLGAISFHEAMEAMVSWPMIAAACVASAASFFLIKSKTS
ncbi:hypothetical protein [Phenylobacterium sp.]|uniref:hypothetical protein n=1 Tax=Phenylobacterium sp. TaxID=1871053 RepID=UPI0035ADFE79